jgi:hypothetical protein
MKDTGVEEWALKLSSIDEKKAFTKLGEVKVQ